MASIKKVFIFCIMISLAGVYAHAQEESSKLDLSDFKKIKKKSKTEALKEKTGEEAKSREETVKDKEETVKDKPVETPPEPKTSDSTYPPSDFRESKEEKPQTKPGEEKLSSKPLEQKPKTTFKEDDDEDKKDRGKSGSSAVRTDEDRTTRYITISGGVAVYYIFRDALFHEAVKGKDSGNADEDFFDPYAMIKLDVRLSRNVRAVVELQNESRDEKLHRTSLGTLYISSRSSQDPFRIDVEQAYVELGEFLFDEFSLQTGIIPHKYSLRADGQSFFMNFREAESPFGTRPDTHAIGVLGTYRPTPLLDLTLDMFYFVTFESRFQRKDESILGLNIDMNLSKEAKKKDESTVYIPRLFNLNFAAIQGDNAKPIWSTGAGFSYFFSDSDVTYTWEFYGEMLFQWGKYNRKGMSPSFPNRNQRHLAFGAYIGTRWSYLGDPTTETTEGNAPPTTSQGWRPYIDVSYWYISGDDDDPYSKKNRDLVTYENIDSTLILEDNDYGLDIDSNYWALKCQIGMNLPIKNEEIKLSIIFGHFEILDSPPRRTHKLGEEMDIRLTWEYTPDVVISVATGILWESQYLEEFFKEAGNKGKEHAFLFRAETSLRF